MRSSTALIGGFGSAFALIGFFGGLYLYFFRDLTHGEEAALDRAVQAAEMDACQKAAFVSPVWQQCTQTSMCFYCTDEGGRMTMVVPPKCTLQGKQGADLNHMQYKNIAPLCNLRLHRTQTELD